MEKWKIGVIIVLLAGVVGFGMFQSRAPEPVEPEVQSTPSTGLPAATGQQPIAWDIPKALWANTAQPIKLDDLKGHVTVLEFWRSECSHCREAVPFMNQLHQRYKDKGVKIVTFQSPGQLTSDNPENSWETVKSFIKANQISYPVAFDTERKLKDQYTKKFGVDLYPFALVLDKKGVIRFAKTGFDTDKARQIVSMVETLLKEK
jgi:thiol-disulfide isomerase/thioredoxin